MKRTLLYILLIMSWLLLPTTATAANLTSSDPYWIGNSKTFGTTEDYDFWLTFMNNAMFNPLEENVKDITFELKFAISARQNTHVIVEIGSVFHQEYDVEAGKTTIVTLDKTLYPQVYLWLSETPGYKGVHVYTEDEDNKFSCFNYSRNGESGESSRDATLILPTSKLGKEYFVQTYYEDTYSSEFAVVATEDNTQVVITPAYTTFYNQPANQPMPTITLNKGDAYLVASAQHQASVTKVDLSGSKICATKPVAVFNGNQQTSIPFDEANSKDYLSEQIIPPTQWGTDFYLAKLGKTRKNFFILTAANNDTHIEIKSHKITGEEYVENVTLNAGETLKPNYINETWDEVTIHADKPIMCYAYTTSAKENNNVECIGDGKDETCYSFGDPANALMPSWAHRAKKMNFFTHELDPLIEADAPEPPQRHMVFIVTTTATASAGKITLDGEAKPASAFKAFASEPNMSYASFEVVDNETHYHNIESSGEGFVGMVYGLSHAQGYLYTLGYTPDPFRDSLFVSNSENIMSKKSYDVEPRLPQGWYQRQWDEWMMGHERLDTAVVCDSSIVSWTLQTPIAKYGEPVDWYIYDVTNTPPTIEKDYRMLPLTESLEGMTDHEQRGDEWRYNWEYQFTLPDESDMDPKARTPYMDYEVQAVIHHPHLICTDLPEDKDTLRMVVRVTRIYHDTIFQIICMGDTLKCFEDSLPHQGAHGNPRVLPDLTQYHTDRRDSTMFIGDKTDGETDKEFEWKARPGENVFRREYQTIFGCDSTYTLFLFVCDTFRLIDTAYLCKNQKVTILEGTENERIYRGIETIEPGIVVTKDTVDEIEAKTKYCACQLDPRYPEFEGCDSIFELHIFLHDIYRDTITDTMCYNRNPDSAYIWKVQNGTRDSLITKSHPNMEYIRDLRVWEGFFSDTLQTKTCQDCNDGNGCDSILVLHLIIPEPFYHDSVDSICLWDYDIDTRTTHKNIYRWYDHRNGANYVDLPNPGHYYDSCFTRFGCDSIYHLELKYTQPFLHVDQHTMANNHTYEWHGQTYGPFPEIKVDTVLYFHDINTNPKNGCDSIYRLELTITDTYLFPEQRAICDIDSVHWRDSIIVGSKWVGTGSFTTRLPDTRTYIVYDSLETKTVPVRDSVYMLTITQYPTYEKTLSEVPLCQNTTEYNWLREDNGALIRHIVFPTKDSYPFDTVYTDTLKTTHDCDSIVHLPIVIYPTYESTVTASICESELPYTWELRDKQNHDQTIQIPADKKGKVWHYTDSYTLSTVNDCDSVVHLDLTVYPTTYYEHTESWCANAGPYPYGEKGKTATTTDTYIDTLIRKNQYGCDSVEILHLIVNPVYELVTDTGICRGKPFVWLRHEGHKLTEMAGKTKTTSIPTDQIGVFEYRDSLTTKAGCDSVWILILHVGDVYGTPVATTERQLCENDTLHFYNEVIYGAKSPLKPAGKEGYAVPEGEVSISFEKQFMDMTIYGCDSAVLHRFTVFPTRYYFATDTVCLDSVNIRYDWTNHSSVEIYQNVAGTRNYVDSLHSDHSDCNCDSIFELQLTVLPSYYKHFRHTMSEEEVYTWEGVSYRGVKATLPHDKTVTKDTVIIVKYDTKNVGTYFCDSILELTLRVGKVWRDTTHQYVCQNEPSYEWYRANEQGVIELRKTISGSDLPEVGEHKLYYDSLLTALNFDSIFVLDLYRAPTYAKDSTAHICQGSPFVWKRHDGASNHVEDVYGNPVSQIPTEHHGEFIYYDRLTTDSFGCDSIWKLILIVDSVYAYTTDTSVCQNEPFVWLRHENHTFQDEHGQDLTTIPTDHSGLFTYTDHLYTTEGCDSVWTLRLRVDTVYTEPVVTTPRQMCENDTLHFYDKVIYGAKSPLKPAEETGYLVPEGQKSIMFDMPYTDKTIHGCDSLVRHSFTIYPTYQFEKIDSVCQGTPYEWEGHSSEYIWDQQQHKQIKLTEIPTQVKSGVVYTYIDSLHTTSCPECRDGAGGCDSIWILKLRVDSVYYHADRITMSDEESRKWQHTVYIGSKVDADTLSAAWFEGEDKRQIVRIPDGKIVNEFDTVYPTIHDCDSTIHLLLLVGPTYRDTIEGWTCDNEPYHWFHAGDSAHEARPDIVILEPKLYYDSLKTIEFGFDSIYVLNLHNYPTYTYEHYDTICQQSPYQWPGHTESEQFYSVEHQRWIHRDAIPTDVAGHFTYIDSLKTHEPELHPDQNRHSGCDSVWTLHLYIPPIYHYYETRDLCENDTLHWQGMLFGGSQYEAYGKSYGNTADFDSTALNLTHGTYHRDIRRPTIYDCDSTYHLTLYVHEVAHTDSIDSVCQGHPFHNPNWNWGEGMYMNTERVGTYISVDTIQSKAGCDSIVTLTLRVDSVYDYRQHYVFCQDTVDTKREWIDEEGHLHEFQMDVSQAGDFDFTEAHTTIHGCDSVYGVTWHVDPIYRFDSTYTICQDSRVTWQRKGYSGDEYGWGYERLKGDRFDTHRDSTFHHYEIGDSILAVGTYYDTAHYTTTAGCDSTYYLKLVVTPAGHYIRDEIACGDDKYHVFYSYDAYGEHTDTVFFEPTTRMYDEMRRDTMYFERERRLTAVDGGCDSTLHFHLTVYPTYEFVTLAKVCWDQSYEWRGKTYMTTGVYYDSIAGGTDYWGCDSVYVLELYKKPITTIPIYDTICDDVTYEHTDTLWYTNGTHSTVETLVWKPGMTIPQTYTEVRFVSPLDGCDSIIYRYYLTINKTYLFQDTATICSNETYQSGEHTYTGYEREYEPGETILPYDTLIRDGFSTIHGCDSIYELYATINPAYRHIDYITICDDGEADWRDHHYEGSMIGDVLGDGLPAGEYTFYDSLRTYLECDSIYELRLRVTPTYLFEENMTKCADDDLTWHGQVLDHLPVGDHFLHDSLTTVGFGCDSVYHLYITVLDTTYEVIYDTICRSESYNLHGVYYMESGIYKDTTLNEWGCNHFTYLHLEVIEPTVPTAWADSICADANAYELYYSYTGRDPIAFSVYYDEFGHQYGFEDVIDMPITTPEELSVLTIPMPWRDDDYHKYPRPDYYPIRLVLDNGICKNRDLCSTDTSIVLSYPSWVTEQRFRDVIAILSEDYNGGYRFSHYQWYRNGEPIPGEALPYLYIPRELDQDTVEYYVRLVREGETESFQTCPIRIYDDFGTDTIAPYMGYLSVVPTCVSTGNPVISILSRHKGTYRVNTVSGQLITEGTFYPNVHEVRLPASEGIYIVHLWSNETPEEPERCIKVQMVSGDRLW